MAGILLGGHGRIVETLSSRLRALRAGDLTAPRVVLLRAPAGEGKSRIIRELFNRLREAGPEPHYWPPMPGTWPTNTADPIGSRGDVTPEGEAGPAPALPTFGWWGIDCACISSSPTHSAVAQVRQQWEAHSRALMLAGNAPTGNAPAAERVIESLREELSDADGAALGRALRSLSHPSLPAVVVIESMHLMGSEVAALIDELSVADPERPVLVIGTVLPEALERPEYAEWTAQAQTHLEVLAHLEILDVPTLPAADLITVLREYAPHTDDATAMRVVAHLGSPLELELWLCSDALRRHVAGHDGAISLEELMLPEGIADVLRLRWAELPAVVRAVLGVAATAAGAGLAAPAAPAAPAVPACPVPRDGLAPFVPELLAEVCDELLADEFTPTQVREGFAAATGPSGWTRVHGGVQYFHDGLLAATAREQGRLALGPARVAELRSIMLRRIERWIDATHDEYTLPDTEVAALLAHRYVALTQPAEHAESAEPSVLTKPVAHAEPAEPVEPDEPDEPAEPVEPAAHAESTGALAAAHWRIACDAAARRDYATAVTHGERALVTLRSVLGENHPAEYLRARGASASASAPGSGSNLGSGSGSASASASDPNSTPDVAPEWAMQLVIAEWLSDQGSVEGSIDALRGLLSEMERHAGTRHMATLTVRSDLAGQLRDSGVTDEAIGQFQTVIADLTQVLGPLAPETLDARGGLAEAFGLAGQYDAAVAELRALIPLFLKARGESDPDTFLVRGALAAFLSQGGQPRAAAEQARMLLDDQERALGAWDTQVLTTRNNLAVMLLDSGDPEAAARQFALLVAERTKVLGATSLDTLDTRMNLAAALMEAGNLQAAVREYRATIGVMRQTLAPDHPTLLRGRGHLAEALGRAGDPAAAARALRALERDMLRAFGPRASDTAMIAEAAKYWERNAQP